MPNSVLNRSYNFLKIIRLKLLLKRKNCFKKWGMSNLKIRKNKKKKNNKKLIWLNYKDKSIFKINNNRKRANKLPLDKNC